MASIKVKFRPSTVDDQEGSIYYQIIHERVPRQLHTGYRIYAGEWDERRGTVGISENKERLPLLLTIREQIRWDVDRLTRIVAWLEGRRLDFTADDIVAEFHRYTSEYTLFNYLIL